MLWEFLGKLALNCTSLGLDFCQELSKLAFLKDEDSHVMSLLWSIVCVLNVLLKLW